MKQISWRRLRAVAMGAVCTLSLAAVPAPPPTSAEVGADAAEAAALKAAPEKASHYDVKGSVAFRSGDSSGRVAWVSGGGRNAAGLLATVDWRGRVTSKVETGKIHEVVAYPAPKSAGHAEAGFAGVIQVSGGGTGFHQETFSLHDPADVSRPVFSQLLYELQWQPGPPTGGTYTLRQATFSVSSDHITETRTETVSRNGERDNFDWKEPRISVHQYAWNARKQKYVAVEAKAGTVVEYREGR